MYNLNDVDKVYKNKIQFYCPNFLCTAGNKSISLRTKQVSKEYLVEPVNSVSTIGAGDNFNAGIIYGILKYGISYHEQVFSCFHSLFLRNQSDDHIIAFSLS